MALVQAPSPGYEVSGSDFFQMNLQIQHLVPLEVNVVHSLNHFYVRVCRETLFSASG